LWEEIEDGEQWQMLEDKRVIEELGSKTIHKKWKSLRRRKKEISFSTIWTTSSNTKKL
jgi:hypothetical protein